ncbi:MAG: hypothetical protein GX446_10620 [Chthonomonadales bacterium]|nr:hypothetical protein [Chthonomonadales bacterium]
MDEDLPSGERERGARNDSEPLSVSGPEIADPLVELIAEAVVRKLDERERIAILADAVLERLVETGLKLPSSELVGTHRPEVREHRAVSKEAI